MTARTFLWTYLGLLGFTALTFGLSFIHLGGVSIAIALLIAFAKGWLVAMFFMGLREHGTASRSALLVGVMLATLLIGFATTDELTRNRPAATSPATQAPAVPNVPVGR